VPGTGRAHNRHVDERKQAEVEYPEPVGEAESLTYRLLAPFWTQIWLRAEAR
jgi:hypothetical protein